MLCPPRPLLGALALAMLWAVPRFAEAQGTGRVTVTVLVPPIPATGVGVRDLEFGSVAPGGTTVVEAVPTAASGHFRIDLGLVRGVEFMLSLPAALEPVSGSAPGLPLAFDGNFARAIVTEQGAVTDHGVWNPFMEPTRQVCKVVVGKVCKRNAYFAAGSLLDVYVGGSLHVPPDQVAGRYSTDIQLTILRTDT